MRWLPIFLSLLIFAYMIAQPERARAYMLPAGCNGSSVSWSNLVPTFRANTFAGASPSGDFAETISLFNRNPTNLSFWQFIDFGMYNVGISNGHTEVWPQLELTDADIFNGDLFAAVGYYYLDGCDIVEGDVIFNLAYQWANTNQKSDYDSYGDGSPDLSGKVAGLHELGHVAGFGHDCGIYNVMGLAWRHLWANGPDASVYLGEPLVAGIVDTYGDVGPPTLQQREVSVSHWQYDSCATGGYSEHRRTSMFDQSGDELAKVAGEVEPRFIAAAGQTIDVDFTFENQGHTIQEGVEVGLYYSTDDTITTMDQRLAGTTFDFIRNDPDTRRLTVTLPLDLPQGDGYIGVIVDENGSINEPNEENNATYIGLRVEGQDADGDGDPDDGTEKFFQYAAKVVCGVQANPVDLRLRPGVYATTVNVFNPDGETVRFEKRLAVSFPPDPQTQGETYSFGYDSLDSLRALETNCDDLIRKAFNGSPPASYFEGFVVITSPKSLDVTAVYSGSAGIPEELQKQAGGPTDKTTGKKDDTCRYKRCGCGCCGCGDDDPGDGDNGGDGGNGGSLTLDIEQIRERMVKRPPPPDKTKGPDLIPVRPFDGDGTNSPESGYCMAIPGFPLPSERIQVIIRNQGDEPAPASQTSVVFGVNGIAPPPDTAVRIADTPALAAGESASHEFQVPTACYGLPGTQCRFVIMADAGPQTVIETNEINNTASSLCDRFEIEG